MDVDREGPGTSSTMKRLEEGRRLPWRLVNYSTWINLANKLDLPSPVSNNDWKGLAEKLGFSTENILVLDNGKERGTIALFKNYHPKNDATVNKVAKALKQMNRDDALQILLDAVPDIEAQYDSESQKSCAEAMEGTDSCVTTMAQVGCGCLGPSSLSFGSQHPRCSLGAPGACCCRHSHVGGVHYPPAPCTPHLHAHAHHGGGGASPAALSSGCGRASNVPPLHNYGATQVGGRQDHGYGPYGGGGGNSRDFYSSSPAQGRSPLRQRSQPCASPLRQPPPERMSSYPEVVQESLVVHPDMDSPHPRELHSFLPGDMEVDGEGGREEEPALLHTAIIRGQGMVSVSPLVGQDLALDATDMGEDTPSTSVEELSSSDSGSRLSSLPLNVMRQVSEECNANQPLLSAVAAAAPSKPRTMYDGLDSMTPWGGGEASAGEGQRNAGKNQLDKFGDREGQSSLKQLESLSQLPSRFMPGNKFTTMVAEQQIEDVPPNNGRGLRVNIKRERDSTRSCQFSSLSSSRSGGALNGKNKGLAGADTYPLRIKPQTGGSMVDEVRSRKPGALMKTTSVPIDMKVEEFKKAFRHIKVFVTYASDSKHHCRQVLSLCNCLDRNGFSCCVDVGARHDSPEQVQATRDWCGRKFKEADFVLICLSPLYLKEIGAADSPQRPKPPSGGQVKAERTSLHTAFIYQLMQEEYQATKRCSRFVSVHMEEALGGAHSPAWLARHLSYQWPRQYKDLLWMLTKPEERIKQRSKSSPQKALNVLKDRVNGHHRGGGDQIVSSPLN